MPWTKARNIRAGESIETTNGVRQVVEAKRRRSVLDERRVWITTDAGDRLHIPENQLVHRIGPTAATLNRVRTTHRVHPTDPRFTACLLKQPSPRSCREPFPISEDPTCETCWYAR